MAAMQGVTSIFDNPSFLTAARILNQRGIEWCVFAGAAARLYGTTRQITDIDVLLRVDPAVLDELLPHWAVVKPGVIEQGGVEIQCAPLRMQRDRSYQWVWDDLASQHIYTSPLESLLLRAMAVEDVIVIKAILQRGADRGKHDLSDIRAILDAKTAAVDFDYLWERVRRCDAFSRVRSALDGVLLRDGDADPHDHRSPEGAK
jgi:hypothetical protein